MEWEFSLEIFHFDWLTICGFACMLPVQQTTCAVLAGTPNHIQKIHLINISRQAQGYRQGEALPFDWWNELQIRYNHSPVTLSA